MSAQKDYLNEVALARLAKADSSTRALFDRASEIVIFGSMASGVERPDSDIDIMCFGDRECKFKSRSIDLMMLPRASCRTANWLCSELASHVSRYGVWIKGDPEWLDAVQIGDQAITEKRRRVQTFIRCLSRSWPNLDECFRVKYSIKIRREAQRLLIISRGESVPPTRMLDESWDQFSTSPSELVELLRGLLPKDRPAFSDEFLKRVNDNFIWAQRIATRP